MTERACAILSREVSRKPQRAGDRVDGLTLTNVCFLREAVIADRRRRSLAEELVHPLGDRHCMASMLTGKHIGDAAGQKAPHPWFAWLRKFDGPSPIQALSFERDAAAALPATAGSRDSRRGICRLPQNLGLGGPPSEGDALLIGTTSYAGTFSAWVPAGTSCNPGGATSQRN